jgi:hypothetical protein
MGDRDSVRRIVVQSLDRLFRLTLFMVGAYRLKLAAWDIADSITAEPVREVNGGDPRQHSRSV